MGRITYLPNISKVKDAEELANIVGTVFSQMLSEINGKLTFQQNVRASGLLTLTWASGEIKTVSHSFNAIPVGFIVVKPTAAASLYAPQGAQYNWSDQVIYIKASAAVTASFYII